MAQSQEQPSKRFYGLKQVFPPEDELDKTKNAKLDIVILHGLDAESPKTWIAWKTPRVPTSGDVNWTSDPEMLPDAMPMARILTYDWNADFDTKASNDLFEGHADTLLSWVHDNRTQAGNLDRPIIFIASCFSGLLVAKALIRADASYNQRSSENTRLLQSLIGLVFLGTPFGGWWLQGQLAVKARVNYAEASARETGAVWSKQLLQYLGKSTPDKPGPLDSLIKDFTEWLVHFRIPTSCFFESEPSGHERLWEKVPGDFAGEADRLGSGIAVTRESACLPGHFHVGVNVRHAMLHKFNSSTCEGFVRLRERLRAYWEKADQTRNLMDIILQNDPLGYLSYQVKADLRSSVADLLSESRSYRSTELGQVKKPLGSCNWILDTKEYKSWCRHALSEQPYPLLLLQGKAGCGKSMVMHTLVTYSQVQDAGISDLQLSHFFDARSTSMQGLSRGFYRSMLAQLLASISPSETVLNCVRQWNKSRGDRDDVNWLKEQILFFFGHVKADAVSLFLDALDECSSGLGGSADVLDFLATLNSRGASQGKLRVCVSARSPQPFHHVLKPTYVVSVAQHNGDDIERYLEENLRGIKTPEFQAKLAHELASRALNMFQWVYLVVKRIKKDAASGYGEEEMMRRISKLPDELNPLYESLLENLDPNREKDANDLLNLVFVALRPLNIDEVRSAMEYTRRADNGPSQAIELLPHEFESRLNTLCSGLVEIRVRLVETKARLTSREGFPKSPVIGIREEKLVQFTHQSVRDFLVEREGKKEEVSSLSDTSTAITHLKVAKVCMQVVQDEDRDAPFSAYAMQFWTAHARKGERAIDGKFEPPRFVTRCSLLRTENIVCEFVACVRRNGRFNQAVNWEDLVKWRLLLDEKCIIVLLALEGCASLLRRHLEECLQREECCDNPGVVHRALCRAVLRGHLEVVGVIRDFINQRRSHRPLNIQMNEADPMEGETPLSLACIHGRAEFVSVLLGMGCKLLGAAGEGPCEPLHIAVNNEDLALIEIILQHATEEGIKEKVLASQGPDGCTVIHQAVEAGSSRVLRELLEPLARDEHRRVVGIKSKRGETAHDVAGREDEQGRSKRRKAEGPIMKSLLKAWEG